jgi:hypothetical protein
MEASKDAKQQLEIMNRNTTLEIGETEVAKNLTLDRLNEEIDQLDNLTQPNIIFSWIY